LGVVTSPAWHPASPRYAPAQVAPPARAPGARPPGARPAEGGPHCAGPCSHRSSSHGTVKRSLINAGMATAQAPNDRSQKGRDEQGDRELAYDPLASHREFEVAAIDGAPNGAHMEVHALKERPSRLVHLLFENHRFISLRKSEEDIMVFPEPNCRNQRLR
jgi:hypothetical protein